MTITPSEALAGALLLAAVGLLLILVAELMVHRSESEDRLETVIRLWRYGYSALAFGFAALALWLWLVRALEPPLSKDDRPFGALAMLVLGALLSFLPLRAKRRVDDLRKRSRNPDGWTFLTVGLQSWGWLFILIGLIYLAIWLLKNL